MKRKRFVKTAAVFGGLHFMTSLLIVPLTLRVGELFMGDAGPNPILTALHLLTRVLYFPVVGLALYPRHWFPGPWIAIPILVNSLFWGMFLAGIVRLFVFLGTKR